jgi:O-acetylhomoserine (thiol)-lyase
MPGSGRPQHGRARVPIFQTTSYVFEDPESARRTSTCRSTGNTYSRIMNPTVAVFEERMANLEADAAPWRFASGIAAQAAALFTCCAGDHVVSSSALYGGPSTSSSICSARCRGADVGRSRRSRRLEGRGEPNTKAFYGETIGNPAATCSTSRRSRRSRTITAPAHRGQHLRDAVPLPPIEWGATSSCTRPPSSSAATAPASAAWWWTRGSSTGRTAAFRSIADPSPAYHGLQFHETFGTYGYLMKLRAETLRDLGAAMRPFNAFLFLQGLETLSLRMARHVRECDARGAVPRVTRAASTSVTYPGLRSAASAARRRYFRSEPARCSRSIAAGGGRRPGVHSRRVAVVASGQRRRLRRASSSIRPAPRTAS